MANGSRMGAIWVLFIASAFLMTMGVQCGEDKSDTASGTSVSSQASDTQVAERNQSRGGVTGRAADPEKGRPAVKWPPRTGRNDEAAIGLTKDDKVFVGVAEEDPIQAKDFSIGSDLALMPERGVSKVAGGTLVTKVRAIRKEARFSDWDYIYADPNHSQILSWGYTVTSGEVLLPRSVFTKAPAEAYAQTVFQCEDFGEYFVLLKLDPNKGHRLCVIGQSHPTIGLIGSRAEIDGTVISLKPDGWYDSDEIVYAFDRTTPTK